ncbi:short-chain collagen C4-like [Mytilus galloprovincialis]|uniref:short-chain collagen C4-like n=1 Tax=Mytilus galloprovincialis TaxID=29158 RepID=UPI003F7C2F72
MQGTIQNQARMIEKFAVTAPSVVVYIRWGRKDCAGNDTDLVYSGISGGGHYSEQGRAAEPICLPHDPHIGNTINNNLYTSVYGLEYQENLGSSLYDTDVPCAVCMANHITSKVIIPGKITYLAGWRKEYSGMLVARYHGHVGASSFICIDQHPDVLEAGAGNEDGYFIYPAIAKCGSLKCPPYVQNTRISCVVCTK